MRFHQTLFLLFALAQTAPSLAQSHLPDSGKAERRRSIAVVMASDGNLHQGSINFYRSAYKAVSASGEWTVLPMETVRKALATGSSLHLGGIPVINRATFRAGLPKRVRRQDGPSTLPGTTNRELQRLLDTLGSQGAIVSDCARQGPNALKACALYYYERARGHVMASTVKKFSAGATDASVWAEPMVKNLNEGLAASQREKDRAIIDELVARKEDDDDEDTRGVIAIFARGDRLRLNGWSQTVAGGGLQLGFRRDSIGVLAELGKLTWSGSGDVTKAERTNYGLNMQFRARALESLLWFLTVGGGAEESKFQGTAGEDRMLVKGLYVSLGPAVGLEVNDYLSMDLGLSWRWFFAKSTDKAGAFQTQALNAAGSTALSLRLACELF